MEVDCEAHVDKLALFTTLECR